MQTQRMCKAMVAACLLPFWACRGGLLTEPSTYYRDADGDGYGDPEFIQRVDSTPEGYVLDGTDCNDTDARFHPFADEPSSEHQDFNCDGKVDLTLEQNSGSYEVYVAQVGTVILDIPKNAIQAVNGGTVEIKIERSPLNDGTDIWRELEPLGSAVRFTAGEGLTFDDVFEVEYPLEIPPGESAVSSCDEVGVYQINDDAMDANVGNVIGGALPQVSCDLAQGRVKVTMAHFSTYVPASGGEIVFRPEYLQEDLDASTGKYAVHATNSASIERFWTYTVSSSNGPPTDVEGAPLNVISYCTYSSGQAADGECISSAAVVWDAKLSKYMAKVSLTPRTSATHLEMFVFDNDRSYKAGTPNDTCSEAGEKYLVQSSKARLVSGYLDFDTDSSREIYECLQVEVCGAGSTYFLDSDGDGFGDSREKTPACSAPASYVANSDDCDDGDATVNPEAEEACNGQDENCDGEVDEGVLQPFFQDGDGDGYGDAGHFQFACTAPEGYVADSTDCNDKLALVHPSADEICNEIDDDCDGVADEDVQLAFYPDLDEDGYGDSSNPTLACKQAANQTSVSGDCDDQNPEVNPGVEEKCNGVDDNCDGESDTLSAQTFYRDQDSDGYGVADDPRATVSACTAPSGYVSDHTDCNDSVNSIHPNAPERCNDLDDDCDSLIDEGLHLTYYFDNDGDGYGDALLPFDACDPPEDGVLNDFDCDDTNASIYPGALEVCNSSDDDCDEERDEGVTTTYYRDTDGDGYGNPDVATQACSAPKGYVKEPANDCNDSDASSYPGASEICDQKDNDCDSTTDDGVLSRFFRDSDGDGYGNADASKDACTVPEGFVSDSTDCNDWDASVHPNASEVCDAKDNDCDKTVDEGVTSPFYKDQDGDDFGDPTISVQACEAPEGYTADSTDCTDADASVHPLADEVCNQKDDNCDGEVDEDLLKTWYRDSDEDSYGDSTLNVQGCSAPTGYVEDSTDCDDSNAQVHPTALETCNGVDDDCDGSVDEGVLPTWYPDKDNDGYGATGSGTQSCTAPANTAANQADCDDTNARVYPGALETCNSVDDDCDKSVDEGLLVNYYGDLDGDGYGRAGSTPTPSCTAMAGMVTNNTDCNDDNSAVSPKAVETCNAADDNCNGIIDEGLTLQTWYGDSDGDKYGDVNQPLYACIQPAHSASNASDCNDSDPAVYPGATELCNGIDDDCDSQKDEGSSTKTWYLDQDVDGYGTTASSVQVWCPPPGYSAYSTDCNDQDSTIHPNATDTCNDVDDDCDGQVDEVATTVWCQDADGDGFGTSSVTTSGCAQPSGYVADCSDCVDNNKVINPGVQEVCDSSNVDENCNGKADDQDPSLNTATWLSWYPDTDKDTYGANNVTAVRQCDNPSTSSATYVANSSDCNDAVSSIHPGASEICDYTDQDCDGSVDEGVSITYYEDDDQDKYGNPEISKPACSPPGGYVQLGTDCDDEDNKQYPGALEVDNDDPNTPEIEDPEDDDCDGVVDEEWVAFARGYYHFLALRIDGTVWAWGNNYYGQLGTGGRTSSLEPVQVGGLKGVIAIAAGGSHSLALLTDGSIWGWGLNNSGQLGDGTWTNSSTPVKVQANRLTSAKAIGAGNSHSLSVKDDGTVWAWGSGGSFELGVGTQTSSNVPVQSIGLSSVIAVTGGGGTSFALSSDGSVSGWGLAWAGTSAGDTCVIYTGAVHVYYVTTPLGVRGLAHTTAIQAGYDFAMALGEDGTVRTWGQNTYGQLGDGTTSTAQYSAVIVQNISRAVKIAGGGYFGLAALENGEVYAWGQNNYGQLGIGSADTSAHPFPVQVLGLDHLTDLSASYYSSLAQDIDENVYAWGYNYYGQLGDGTTTDRWIPTQNLLSQE